LWYQSQGLPQENVPAFNLGRVTLFGLLDLAPKELNFVLLAGQGIAKDVDNRGVALDRCRDTVGTRVGFCPDNHPAVACLVSGELAALNPLSDRVNCDTKTSRCLRNRDRCRDRFGTVSG